MDRKTGLFLEIPLLALLIIFAFWMTFQSGSRGFFAFDQSIVFDGGYRVLIGQMPYRDFIIPIGPVVFWIQAIFFLLLGVNYYACIFAAALFNVLASLLTVGAIRLLFPGRRIISYAGGLLTAVWFYPPFGTLYYDQTAFFFSLLALYVLLFSIIKASERPLLRTALIILTGVFAVLAFLSKQNAGLFFIPIFPLILLGSYRRGLKGAVSDCAIFFAACLVTFFAFLMWLHIWSDLSDFIVFFFKVPSQIGMRRIMKPGGITGIAGFIYTGAGPVVNRVIVDFSCLLSVLFLILYGANFDTVGTKWRHYFIASLACLYCSFYQYFFLFTTKNNSENCMPFLGLIFGIGGALAGTLLSDMAMNIHVSGRKLHSPSRSTLRCLVILFLALSLTYSVKRGRSLSLSRSVHEVFVRPVFNPPSSIDKLESLRWGKFTRTRGYWHYEDRKEYMESPGITEDDFASLIEYLRELKAPFFVFPDNTVLYGLVDATPPQPLLWIDEGLTYPAEYDPYIDERIVGELQKNNTETIVLEEDSFWGTDERLDHFPRLKAHIDEQFHEVKRIGIFIILKKSHSPRELEPDDSL